jgi:hypothetical protein
MRNAKMGTKLNVTYKKTVISLEVNVTAWGVVGVHKSILFSDWRGPTLWTVTHLPTGDALCKILLSKKDAMSLAGCVESLLPPTADFDRRRFEPDPLRESQEATRRWLIEHGYNEGGDEPTN